MLAIVSHNKSDPSSKGADRYEASPLPRNSLWTPFDATASEERSSGWNFVIQAVCRWKAVLHLRGIFANDKKSGRCVPSLFT